MSEGQGTISSQDLMKKLVQAKKVMNKVDSGNYEKGHIDENIIKSNPEELLSENKNIQKPHVRPIGPPNVEKIHQSKLPDAIKKAMIENPIPQISLNDSLDMNFIKGAKRLMEQEGVSTTKTSTTKINNNSINNNDLVSILTPIIESTVRKVMDEKLNQILTAQKTTSINENLVLKVGDSVFKGKITGVNKAT